ncbi:hypothetical protein DRN73_05165 [Candidatus Pacearchaeota archaeon]|nr:MAG: hypothetical protein DRN73_05165 [Candidatus Pacearchaeota archaeon]
MSKFYEILEKLKNNSQKKKYTFVNKRYIFFLFIIILLGSSLSFFVYYLKLHYKEKIYSETPKKLSNTETYMAKTQIKSQTQAITLPQTQTRTQTQAQINTKKISIKKKKQSPPQKSKTFASISPSALQKKSSNLQKNETKSNYSVSSENVYSKGFLLKEEDLLNNLLIMAEEERKSGNCEKAIFYYQNYLKKSFNVYVMNNYGACLIELGRFDEAIDILNKALNIKNDPEIKFNLALAYIKKGEKEKACAIVKSLEIENKFLKTFKSLCKSF